MRWGLIFKNRSKCTTDLSDEFIRKFRFCNNLVCRRGCQLFLWMLKHWYNEDQPNDEYDGKPYITAFQQTRNNIAKSIKEFEGFVCTIGNEQVAPGIGIEPTTN